MNLGALAIGLAVGFALWTATDNVVFLSVGLVFAIAFGLFDKKSSDEDGGPADADEPEEHGHVDGDDGAR